MGAREYMLGLLTKNGEMSGDGYSRAPVQLFREDSGYVNLDIVTMPQAKGDWGTLIAVSFFDKNNNEVLRVGVTPTIVTSGTIVQFNGRDIVVDLRLLPPEREEIHEIIGYDS
jgi:hypothetical protein